MQSSILIILIAIFSQTVVPSDAQQVNPMLPKRGECGQLKEDYLYNEKSIAAFDEYPWIGRVGYTVAESNTVRYLCLAVLISRRHLLANSQCFRDVVRRQNEPTSVLLGDWNKANNATEPDCNEDGECAPLPREYEIADIALHPDFNNRAKVNDIAVLTLAAAVVLSDYVQPICLPSAEEINADFIAQYLPYGGFDGLNTDEDRKTKTLAHVLNAQSCRKRYGVGIITAEQHLCVTCTTAANDFMSGSPLMGVAVENSKPHHFYLIGLLAFGAQTCQPDVIQKISPVLNWIKENVA